MNDAERERLQFFRNALRTNKHHLDDELEVQAEYQEQIGRFQSQAERRRDEAKDDLAKAEARLIEDFRDEKSTKDLAEAKARRHPDRVRAFERFQDASEDFREWDALLRAWVSKGYQLQTLSDLFARDYFALTSTRAPKEREERPQWQRPRTRARIEAD
jgi:hypothetical protein